LCCVFPCNNFWTNWSYVNTSNCMQLIPQGTFHINFFNAHSILNTNTAVVRNISTSCIILNFSVHLYVRKILRVFCTVFVFKIKKNIFSTTSLYNTSG
jgi:hypothetical protein